MRVNERPSATDARATSRPTMRAPPVASGGGALRDATRATRAKPNATRLERASNARWTTRETRKRWRLETNDRRID